MSKLIEKPHLIFLLSLPLIILSGALSSNKTLDINVHDTYFVFSQNDLTILMSIIFGIIGIGYWIMAKANKRLSKWLNFIHIVLTFGGILLIMFFMSQMVEANAFSKSDDFARNVRLEMQIILMMIVVVIGQFFFLINIIRGLVIKPNRTKT